MRLDDAINIEDLHKLAKRRLPKVAFDFIEGGLEDEHGLFEAVLFPQTFRRYRSLVGTLGPYEVTGKVESRYDALAITVERIARPARPPNRAPEKARAIPELSPTGPSSA